MEAIGERTEGGVKNQEDLGKKLYLLLTAFPGWPVGGKREREKERCRELTGEKSFVCKSTLGGSVGLKRQAFLSRGSSFNISQSHRDGRWDSALVLSLLLTEKVRLAFNELPRASGWTLRRQHFIFYGLDGHRDELN